MSELVFRVRAEYDSAIQCRKELDEVVKKMKELDESSSPQEIEKYVKRYAELTAAYDKSLSFIGKTGALITETWKGVVREIQYNINATENLGTKQRSIIDTAQKRLQLEENIFDTLKKQREVEDAKRKTLESRNTTNQEGLERNKRKLSQLESALSTKYTGRDESTYSDSDKALLDKGRESVKKWEEALESSTEALSRCSAQVMVYDQLMEDSKGRTEQLTKVVGEVSNAYMGFSKTVESTAPKVFISEEVFRRYDELKTTIDDLQKKLEDAAKDPNVDISYVKDLQGQLSAAQEEFRALDNAAKNTASVLGTDLANKTEKALEKFYESNDLVRKVTIQVKDFEEKLESAKKKLAEAKDPVAVTKAREEIDNLQRSLDNATDRLAKFKTNRKDALEEVQRLNKEISGGDKSGGPDIAGAVSDQVKGLMGNIAAITGIGFGLNELKDFFAQSKQWREYFQDIESSMKVFLGSAEKGAEFTAKLKDYAYYNMFEFSDLAQASQQMISYGHNVESIIPRLDQLSNVATGTHGSLMELVNTYNRAKATGVVDARGIQSWAVKGVMIKDVLRDMGEVTAGTTVTFEQLNKVLDKITGEGGQFHNLMLEMMDNISAESGQLEDNLAAMYEEVGSKFEGVFVKWLKLQSAMAAGRNSFVSDEMLDWGAEKANAVLDDLLKNWEKYLATIKNIVVAYGVYRAALIANNALEKAHAAWKSFSAAATEYSALAAKREAAAKISETAAETANTGATNLNTSSKVANAKASDLLSLAMIRLRTAMMAHPFALVVAGLAAVAYAIYSYYDGIMTTEKAQRLLNKASEDYSESLKEQEQKDRTNIGIIQDKTKSLKEQTKAYRDLIAERQTFGKYTRDEIANMSSEQVSRLLSEDNAKKEEEAVRNRLAAMEELQRRFNRKGGAWAYSQDSDIEEVVKQFNLGEEFEKQLKESIGSMTNLSDWAKELATNAGNDLREYLKKEVEAGVIDGLAGVSKGEVFSKANSLIENFSSAMQSSTGSIQKELTDAEDRIKALKAANKKDISTKERTENNKDIEALNSKVAILSKRLDDARSKVARTFSKELTPQIKAAEENVETLNHQLAAATGNKRVEIEAKLKQATDERDWLQSVMKLIEEGKADAELIITVKRKMENKELGDDKLIEIGDAYKEVENAGQKVTDRILEAREAFDKLKDKSDESAKKIIEDYHITANDIDGDFNKIQESLSTNLTKMKGDLKNLKEGTEEYRKLEIEIKRKEQLQKYLEDLKTTLKNISSNPFDVILNISAIIPDKLKKIIKEFTGIDLTENEKNTTTESEQAQQEGNEALVRKNTAPKEPEKKTGNEWKAEEKAALLARKKELENLLKQNITQKEAEQYQKELDQIKAALKKGAAEGKKLLARQAKEVADELKYQEQLTNAKLDAERARTDAVIALEESDYIREKSVRDEQHRRTLEDLQDQEEEIYKKIYQQRKADYDNKHSESGMKYENTKEGKAGWSVDVMAGTLNKKEQALYDAENAKRIANIDKENAEYARVIRDRYAQESKAMTDFLSKWGDYEQQKLAITMEYEEKIRQASSPIEKANLTLERDEKYEKLKQEKLKDNIDWDGVFSDLEGHTREYLIGLRDQLQGLLDSGDITDLTQLETIQGKIQDINGEISKQNGLFEFQGDRAREHERLLQRATDARENLDAAKDEELDAERNIEDINKEIAELMSSVGEDVDAGEIDKEGLLENIGRDFGADSDEYKKAEELLTNLTIAEGGLTQARKKTKDATDKAKQAEDASKRKSAQAVADWFSDAQQFISEKGIDQIPDLLNEVGLGDLGEKAGQGLSAFNNAAGAAADFASGNYIGAALKGISAIKDVGSMLGIASNSNRAEIEEANAKLQIAMDVNTEAINRNTEAIKNSSPIEALDIYKQTKRAMQQNEQAARRQLENYAYMYDGGHSLNYDMDTGGGVVQAIFKKLGLAPNGTYDLGGLLRTLSASDWNKLYDDEEGQALLTRLGEAIANAEDDGNYNGMFGQILDFANNFSADKYEQLLNTLRESITGISFDSLLDNFRSNIMDMDKTAKDFSNDFEGYLRSAIYNAMITDALKPKLQEWYGAFSSFVSNKETANGRVLTTSEISRLMKTGGTYVDEDGVSRTFEGLDKLNKSALEMRDNIELLGLYNGKNYSQQDAAHGSATSISYDQADSLIGIEMAKQIILEQILKLMRGGGMTIDGISDEGTSNLDQYIVTSVTNEKLDIIIGQIDAIKAESVSSLGDLVVLVKDIFKNNGVTTDLSQIFANTTFNNGRNDYINEAIAKKFLGKNAENYGWKDIQDIYNAATTKYGWGQTIAKELLKGYDLSSYETFLAQLGKEFGSQFDALYGVTQTNSGLDTAVEISLLTARAENILSVASQSRDIAADSRDILAGMAIHVEEIRDGVVDTIVPRIKNIDDNLNKVYKIVENQ